jgi:preprotein translocase SecE subunit
VARDRQRSKARQRARATGDTPPKRRRSRVRGEQVDEATGLPAQEPVEDGLPADTTPDELEGAFPNVDEAHLAEAGGFTGDEAFTDDELAEQSDRAADEVQVPRDLQARRPGRSLDGPVEGAAPAEHRDRGRVITFLRSSADELSRVQWPDRKHVFQATAVVLGFVLIAGGWLGLMDAIWQPLINAIL